MKLLAIVMMVMMSSVAFALQPPVDLADTEAQDAENAGMLPDAPLYGLDLALEKVSLALAGNSYNRALIALEQAKEHLAEAKIMAKQDKIDARDKALKAHDDRLADINSHKNGLSEEHRATVEENMNKHVNVLLNVQDKLEAKNVPASTKGITNAIENSQKALTDVRDAKVQKGLQGIEQNIKK